MKSLPRNFSRVFALAGDSTMTMDLAMQLGRRKLSQRAAKRKPACLHSSNTYAFPKCVSLDARGTKAISTPPPRDAVPSSVQARGEPAALELEEAREHGRRRQIERLGQLLGRQRLLARQDLEDAARLGGELAPAAADARRPARSGRAPTAGKSSASTSSAPRQRIAPSRSSSCVPAEVSEKIEPGTANTSRPKSAASRAVMREPERREASTTTTPEESPAMMRLRIGKFCGRGSVPGRVLRHEKLLRRASAP